MDPALVRRGPIIMCCYIYVVSSISNRITGIGCRQAHVVYSDGVVLAWVGVVSPAGIHILVIICRAGVGVVLVWGRGGAHAGL